MGRNSLISRHGPSEVIYKGHLRKKSPRVLLGHRVWQTRFFVLYSSSKLMWWHSMWLFQQAEKDTGKENTLRPLEIACYVSRVERHRDPARATQFLLHICGYQCPFELQAPTAGEATKWIELLQNKINSRNCQEPHCQTIGNALPRPTSVQMTDVQHMRVVPQRRTMRRQSLSQILEQRRRASMVVKMQQSQALKPPKPLAAASRGGVKPAVTDKKALTKLKAMLVKIADVPNQDVHDSIVGHFRREAEGGRGGVKPVVTDKKAKMAKNNQEAGKKALAKLKAMLVEIADFANQDVHDSMVGHFRREAKRMSQTSENWNLECQGNAPFS